MLEHSSGLPAGRVSAESIAGRECAESGSNEATGGLQHTCRQQAAGAPGGCLAEVQGSASASLQLMLLACSGAGQRPAPPPTPTAHEQHALALRAYPAHRPSNQGHLHAEAHTLPSTPNYQHRHWLCIAARMCLVSRVPSCAREQHRTPSGAQHALDQTFLLSPLLQATSPAILPPCATKLAASPASCARSTLSGLTVSRSTAMAAISMPSWACAWLCCALKGYMSHCTGCQLCVPAHTTIEVPSPHLTA